MAVANQVNSTAQQIGARIGWNLIDAATQPPTGTRKRVLNLSDPRTDHRNLGFEDSCLYARRINMDTRRQLDFSKSIVAEAKIESGHVLYRLKTTSRRK